MILPISDHEAALVLTALGYFDEEVLTYSVPHIELYRLIKDIQETFGFEVCEGYVLHPKSDLLGSPNNNLSPDAAD